MSDGISTDQNDGTRQTVTLLEAARRHAMKEYSGELPAPDDVINAAMADFVSGAFWQRDQDIKIAKEHYEYQQTGMEGAELEQFCYHEGGAATALTIAKAIRGEPPHPECGAV